LPGDLILDVAVCTFKRVIPARLPALRAQVVAQCSSNLLGDRQDTAGVLA